MLSLIEFWELDINSKIQDASENFTQRKIQDEDRPVLTLTGISRHRTWLLARSRRMVTPGAEKGCLSSWPPLELTSAEPSVRKQANPNERECELHRRDSRTRCQRKHCFEISQWSLTYYEVLGIESSAGNKMPDGVRYLWSFRTTDYKQPLTGGRLCLPWRGTSVSHWFRSELLHNYIYACDLLTFPCRGIIG